MSKPIGVQKGTKRAPYARCKQKREFKSEDLQGGLSYQEIGEILGIHPGEVQRIEAEAMRKLRKPSEKTRKLHGYHNTHLTPSGAIEG